MRRVLASPSGSAVQLYKLNYSVLIRGLSAALNYYSMARILFAGCISFVFEFNTIN